MLKTEQNMGLLAEVTMRHTPGDGVHETAIPGLGLIRQSQPTEPLQILHHPAVCIIAQGEKEVALADLRYCYNPAKYLVVSVDLPLSGQVTKASPELPYLCVRIDLDAAMLASVLTEKGASAIAKGSVERGLFISDMSSDLAGAAIRLVRLLDEPEHIPFLAPLLLREIYYRLLAGEQSGAVRHIATAGSKIHQIGRAIAWIKEHYAQPFSIEVVANEARMSPSAFHHYFREVTAMSPLQYQKQVRLQEARRLMVGGAFDAAAAGYEVGYESPSQFTREYRRLFGAPPVRDVTRLRAQGLDLQTA
ncbi:AraC-type DNA-binding protein [Mesorhizobium albiziae]|uniref:AraC-type DNA-binding protein n=1 Tax=Neomesorhizobium albiziae TaxID=335020 RepID=A0A1I4CLA1_9HYPH|nr:AraC family transcriptional regulator [Mesorhizobium albiziae]GLS29283.1 transcriptional regulator [Mesorhizobium albiziae]SFK81019.1 AraC-type DNA-binding protein [Mesorhizobium albiziae]